MLKKIEGVKQKAIFMAFLIICSVFYFGLSTIDVEAQRSPSRSLSTQQACCEKTKSGDFCVYTDKNECDRNSRSSLTTCENTNYCSVGTCIYDKEGECFANTPKSLCEKNNGVWSNEPIEQISQCQKGCCQLSNECSFVTQNKCKSIVSQFPDLNMIFDKNIENEAACVDKCRSDEKGACVSLDGSCTFTTRANCNQESSSVADNTQNTNLKTGFHPNVLCSNSLLGTNCARQQKTGCFEEKVFWFDSCGNPENVFDANKDRSYNKGFILKGSSCNLKGPNDPNCGMCDYSQGTLCGKAPDNVDMAFGEFSCNDLSCKTITENIASPDSGGKKETGESWCLYDARVGFGQDVVGSRHYRALCLNGEEVIEPCKDYREELCAQGTSDSLKLNLGQVFNIGEGFLESACRANRYKECQSCNEIGGSCGGECNDLSGLARVACCRQQCCNDIGNKDCFFMAGGVSDFGGMCVPLVPPGLLFWEGGSSGGGSKDGTQTGANSVCNEASVTCEVKFVRGGAGRFGIGVEGLSSTGNEWECVKNCHCLEKDWVKAAAAQCSARGDCGAKYNIKGRFTSGGFSEDTEFVLTQKDFENWNTLSRQNTRRDDSTNLGGFWERSWPAVLVIFGTGLAAGTVSALIPGAVSGTFVSAFGSGLVLGPKTFLQFGEATIEQTYLEAFRQGITSSDLAAWNAILEKPDNAVKMIFQTSEEGTNWVFLNDKGTVIKKATEAQVTAATEASFTGGNTVLIAALEIINVSSWIYLIYQVIDIAGKEDKKETFSVSCNAWEPPKGGDECKKCNEKGKDCSEYRCRSLGKLCRLINEGTDEEKCVAQTPIDVSSPKISAVKPKNLVIEEVKNQGFTIKTLIKPFTPVELKIATDEPSKCKFDTNVSIKYENMKFNFGDNLFRTEHEMLFSLPSELVEEEAIRLTNGGRYSLYIRCIDANENANNKDYYIKFEINKGPDLTAPKIELTSIKNNGFVADNILDAGLDVFVNEPSECRWDRNDIDYDSMKNSFICARSGLDQSPLRQGLYRCSGLLNDIKKGKNNFYFRCKDQPQKTEGRNVNKESYQFSLIRTEKLGITSIEPKDKVFRTNPKIIVKTALGAENGVSFCGYSNERNAELSSIPQFAKTNSSTHEQQLRNLRKGRYTFYVTCVDVAGNTAKDSASFEVAADVSQNVISNVYKDTRNNILIIGTNEDSTCYYDNKQFNFGEGIPMTDANSKKHEAVLPVRSYFVLCKDAFNNEESITVYP